MSIVKKSDGGDDGNNGVDYGQVFGTAAGVVNAAIAVAKLFKNPDDDEHRYHSYTILIENFSNSPIYLEDFETSYGYLMAADLTIPGSEAGAFEIMMRATTDEDSYVHLKFTDDSKNEIFVSLKYKTPLVKVTIGNGDKKVTSGGNENKKAKVEEMKFKDFTWHFICIDEKGGTVPIQVFGERKEQEITNNVGIGALALIGAAATLVSTTANVISYFKTSSDTKAFEYMLLIENFSDRSFKLKEYDASRAYVMSPDLLIEKEEVAEVAFILRDKHGSDDPGEVTFVYEDKDHKEDEFTIRIKFRVDSPVYITMTGNSHKSTSGEYYPVKPSTLQLNKSSIKFMSIDNSGGKIPLEIRSNK